MKRSVFTAGLFSCMIICSLAAEANDIRNPLHEAREVVMTFGKELRTYLQEQMRRGGPTAAITTCSEIAPSLSSKLSRQTGWMVKRVSLKARNPLDIPDAWEQRILHKFEHDLASSGSADGLEHSELVVQGEARYFRYMKAIPTREICLVCHGEKETLSPEVRLLLEREYPYDTATGYGKGMIRGAFSVKRPMQKNASIP